MSDQHCRAVPEIRIRRVGSALSDQITHQAKQCAGINASDFIKPFLYHILDDFPDYMKEYRGDEKRWGLNENRIRGISLKARRELENIANYLGLDMPALLKVKLGEYMGKLPNKPIIPE